MREMHLVSASRQSSPAGQPVHRRNIKEDGDAAGRSLIVCGRHGRVSLAATARHEDAGTGVDVKVATHHLERTRRMDFGCVQLVAR